MSVDWTIHIVTTSFNKAKYLKELRDSLEAQTVFPAFWWHILDNSTDKETRDLVLSWKDENQPWIDVQIRDFTEDERDSACPHPILLNDFIESVDDGVFVHISDDDLPSPDFIRTLCGFLRFNPDKFSSYVPVTVSQVGGDYFIMGDSIIPTAPVVFTDKIDPRRSLDGNSVMFRISDLKSRLGPRPWPEAWDTSFECDGYMLEAYCKNGGRIWPAATTPMLIHRITELSVWRNSRFGHRSAADAKMPFEVILDGTA